MEERKEEAMAGKQRREKERERRAEALAQSMDKLVFLGEIGRPEPPKDGIPKPRDAEEGDED